MPFPAILALLSPSGPRSWEGSKMSKSLNDLTLPLAVVSQVGRLGDGNKTISQIGMV